MKQFTKYLPSMLISAIVGGILFTMFSFATTLNEIQNTQRERAVRADAVYKIIEDNNKLISKCIDK